MNSSLQAWLNAGKYGTALAVAIGAFVLPPLDVGDKSWTMFARFLAVAFVIIVATVGTRFSASRYVDLWLSVGVVTMVLGVASLVAYSSLRAAWLVPFDGVTFVSGSPHFTADTAKWLAANPNVRGDAELIRKFTTFHVGDIWDDRVVRWRTGTLIAVYVSTVELFAVGVLCITQGYSSVRRSPRRTG